MCTMQCAIIRSHLALTVYVKVTKGKRLNGKPASVHLYLGDCDRCSSSRPPCCGRCLGRGRGRSSADTHSYLHENPRRKKKSNADGLAF